MGMLQCLERCQIGIFSFLGHQFAQVTVDVRLQVCLGDIGTEGRAKTCVFAFLTENDATFSRIQRLAYFIKCRS